MWIAASEFYFQLFPQKFPINLSKSRGVHGSGWVWLSGFFDPTHHGWSKKFNPTHMGRVEPMDLKFFIIIIKLSRKKNINILKKPKN